MTPCFSANRSLRVAYFKGFCSLKRKEFLFDPFDSWSKKIFWQKEKKRKMGKNPKILCLLLVDIIFLLFGDQTFPAETNELIFKRVAMHETKNLKPSVVFLYLNWVNHASSMLIFSVAKGLLRSKELPRCHCHFISFPYLTVEKARQVSSMIHSARPSLASSDHCFLLFCFARFEKWGRTYGRTDKTCENNYHSRP